MATPNSNTAVEKLNKELEHKTNVQALGIVDIEQSRAIAEIQAALIIAKKFPRSIINARDRIAQACARKEFAEKAGYQYARGGTAITGASIRMAEEFLRSWGNIVSGISELVRHNGYSECLAYAWDLETNSRDEKRFTVKHWRDRSGSTGYQLTEERDIYELIANMGARRKRACILALIPSDVQDEAVKLCEETLRTTLKLTEETIKSLVNKFAEAGIPLAAIEKRIQRRIESITPAQVIQLGRIYNSMVDGMSAGSDWFDLSQTPVDKLNEDIESPKKKTARQSKEADPKPATDDGEQLAPPAQDNPQAKPDAPQGQTVPVLDILNSQLDELEIKGKKEDLRKWFADNAKNFKELMNKDRAELIKRYQSIIKAKK